MIAPTDTNSHLNGIQATTHYSVNHRESMNLDSSNAFEGPEKLLEVWFAPDEFSLPNGMKSLKDVPRLFWEEMLDIVQCKVLSVIESAKVDAYLLSESSMFVFPHKIILKTCGTTTLLVGLPHLLEISVQKAGYPKNTEPWQLFYSRRSFLFPDRQLHPHKSWKDEVSFLEQYITGGFAYSVGKINTPQHWYLFMKKGYQPSPTLTPTNTHQLPSTTHSSFSSSFSDQTLEILMTDLSKEHAAVFFAKRHSNLLSNDNSSIDTSNSFSNASKNSAESSSAIIDDDEDYEDSDNKNINIKLNTANPSTSEISNNNDKNKNDDNETSSDEDNIFEEDKDFSSESSLSSTSSSIATDPGHVLGAVISKTSGISKLFPDSQLDSFAFMPCGYSVNGIVPGSEAYFTIHVTPEEICSYASFETNISPYSPSQSAQGRVTHTKLSDHKETINNVINIFKPGKFTLTFFETDDTDSISNDSMHSVLNKEFNFNLPGYKRSDKIVYDFDHYKLIYAHFIRFE